MQPLSDVIISKPKYGTSTVHTRVDHVYLGAITQLHLHAYKAECARGYSQTFARRWEATFWLQKENTPDNER